MTSGELQQLSQKITNVEISGLQLRIVSTEPLTQSELYVISVFLKDKEIDTDVEKRLSALEAAK